MTRILSDLLEEYQTNVDIQGGGLYYEYNPLTIERIRDRFLVKCY